MVYEQQISGTPTLKRLCKNFFGVNLPIFDVLSRSEPFRHVTIGCLFEQNFGELNKKTIDSAEL